MKILVFAIVLFTILFVNTIAQQGWFQQNSGTESQLNSVFFLDSLSGWIVGDDSTLLKTTNSGIDWNSVQTGYTGRFQDIYFTTDSTGWIAGDRILLYTSDAGQTWVERWKGTIRTLFAITFVNEKIGYTCGGLYWPGAGIILKTENGGERWDTSFYYPGPWDENFYDLDFVNTEIGWAVGGVAPGSISGKVIKTTDGGKTWIDQTPSINYWPYYDCDFISENEGWIASVGYGYKANLFTKDGGSHWERQAFPDSNSYVLSIFFVDDLAGWCGGIGIFHTTNKGISWTKQWNPITNESFFTSFIFINKNTGWVVGTDGIILKTTNGGVTNVEEEEIEEIPTTYYLSNNYPNPFNPSTKIKYSIPQTSKVVIKVFDVLGNEIETLVDEEKPSGTYEVEFNGSGLPSGIYFYHLNTGTYVETKKMILLK